MKRQLIITADDLGYSESRDSGIFQCFREKGITRATLLINGASATKAIQKAKEENLTIGLHLNLTEGLPISNNIKTLTVEKHNAHRQLVRMFRGKMGLRESLQMKVIDINEIHIEITAQIERFTELVGSPPPFIDGHQHVQVLPDVRSILADVMCQYNIQQIRLPIEDMSHCSWIHSEQLKFYKEVNQQAIESIDVWRERKISDSMLDFLPVSWVSNLLQGVCYNSSGHHGAATKQLKALLRWSSGFLGMACMGKNMTAERLQMLIKLAFQSTLMAKSLSSISELPNDHKEPHQQKETFRMAYGRSEDVISIELMAHPGYCTPETELTWCCSDIPDDFSMSVEREHEMNILSSSDMKLFYEQNKISFGN